METADPFDRDDLPLAHRRGGGKQGFVVRASVCPARIPKREARPAIGTGVRLGVEAAVRLGPRIPPRQAAHIGKCRIEVRARS